MAMYRKRPVIVEARKYTLNTRNEIIKWCNAQHIGIDEDGPPYDLRNIRINTAEGQMIAKPGDYIIKGVHGEFYPCKPEIFRKTYEFVER